MTTQTTRFKILADTTNPLDAVEDILHSHSWAFDRISDEELIVEVSGKSGGYKLFFIWQNDMNALQYCVQFDLQVTKNNFTHAQNTLITLNEKLWMGHFDVPADTRKPAYRYTALLRGVNADTSGDLLEDMIDVSLAQCEQHFPVFSMLASANDLTEQNVSLALMDTAGES